MFNMTKIRATNGAGKSFYANHLAANDYYSESEKVVGCWKGFLTYNFGLLGEKVDLNAFSLFQKGINPLSGGKLTQRRVSGGPRFFDFQVAAPKSVSIMSLFDARLIEAHREAVDEAMRELESLAAVRLRTGDHVFTNNYEITGQIIYAQFHHDASRALDPQLHTHNVVVNVTQDSNGKYKALESLEMCRAIRYAGKVYHNKLSELCRQLGYELENHYDEKGRILWKDIKGIPPEVMELYSKRRHEIEKLEEAFIAEHGRKPTLTENNQLSMSSRASKMKTATSAEVREYQLSQLTAEQKRLLFRKADQVKWSQPEKEWIDPELVQKALREAVHLIFERESVVKLDKVLAEAMNQNLGAYPLEMLKEEAGELPELKKLGGLDINPWVAPQKIIDRELYAIEAVENQRGVFEAIAPEFTAFAGEESRTSQAELIRGLLNSRDRFNLFRGVAGAGKTSTLQEFCRGLRSGGVASIHLIAPTNSAVDVLKQEGFEQSQTAASFLQRSEKPPSGSYVIIDESGLNSLREGVEIIRTARENNYRVLFVGDARQHTAVESGDFFRLLEEHSEIRQFSLTDIHRQQHEEYRRGIMECALGQFEQAFDRFDRNHFIHEGKAKYLEDAAQSYMDYTNNGQRIDRAILVAPTHDEGDRLTDAVRRKLKDHGIVAKEGRTTVVFRSWNWEKTRLKEEKHYSPGYAISFVRTMKGVAKAGETACVEYVKDGMLHLDNGKLLHLKTAADFIEVGELRELELCAGDLIQFNVNLRERKIYNGSLARVTDDPEKVMLLYSDGRKRELVEMPKGYAAFKYGWVTTSHKSQGRTAENVVVAAQGLDCKAFYVSLSRGRKHMALHCPEKAFLKEQLSFRHGNRRSIHDLVRDREVPAGRILALSKEAQAAKERTLPNTRYKSVKGRLGKLADKLKKLAQSIRHFGAQVAARRGRNARYGLEIITGDSAFEIKRNAAIDTEKIMKRKRQEEEHRQNGGDSSGWNLFNELQEFLNTAQDTDNNREEIHDFAEREHAIFVLDSLFTGKKTQRKAALQIPKPVRLPAVPKVASLSEASLTEDERLLAEARTWLESQIDVTDSAVSITEDERLLAEAREWLEEQINTPVQQTGLRESENLPPNENLLEWISKVVEEQEAESIEKKIDAQESIWKLKVKTALKKIQKPESAVLQYPGDSPDLRDEVARRISEQKKHEKVSPAEAIHSSEHKEERQKQAAPDLQRLHYEKIAPEQKLPNQKQSRGMER